MAKVKTALVVAAVAGMATPLALQQRANRGLRAENEALRRQVATFEAFTTRKVSSAPRKGGMPNLPAPPMVPSAPTEPLHGLTGTNLITHILKSDKAPVLPRHQIESYLNENRRSAGSLLAAFRATQDQTLLQEAIEKYPEDPQVAYTAAYRLEGADRRQWLEAFKKAAPDNALANYLSASEHFKAGQVNQAVEELAAASRQGRFTDYTLEFGQSDEEAWRAAGYSVAEAKTIGASSLLLPHLAETKALAHQMVDLARAYRTSGDASSAELTLQMAVDLGRRLDEPDGSPLVTKLVGRAIEGIGLREMAPDTPHSRGKTAQERLAEITQERARIKEIATQFDEVAPRLSEQDWISYRDRWRMFGEEEALRWALNKHGLAVR